MTKRIKMKMITDSVKMEENEFVFFIYAPYPDHQID